MKDDEPKVTAKNTLAVIFVVVAVVVALALVTWPYIGQYIR